MAINLILDKILITLKEEGVVGKGLTDSIFEIGEQNWYGDIQAIDYLEQLINKYVKSEEKNDFFKDYESIKIDSQKNKNISFKIVKLYYKIIFNFKTYKAIDFHGTIFSTEKDYQYKGFNVYVFKLIDFPFFVFPGIFNFINRFRFKRFLNIV